MRKSKYRIYTFTPRKSILKLVLVFIAIILFFVIVHCVPKPEIKVNNKFIKKTLDSVFYMTDKEYKKDFSASKIKIHNIMNQLSPVFANSDKSVSLQHSDKKEPGHSTAPIVNAAKKVNAKTIVSDITDIKNETSYSVDVQSLLNKERKYNGCGNEPKVLIIHTHACETYSHKNGAGLGENGEYRTTDEGKNMIKIGEIITNVLKEKGINVLHDKTLCDYPAYNNSYVKSLEVIENYLSKYPTIEFVFDIHRDAIADEKGNPTKLTCKINGEVAAQAMIVCGTDAMGLENPNWQENLILALKIQKNMEQKYPGFMRPINLRRERFNMHKTKGSLLFEVGTHGNTMEEAQNAARYLAEGIAKVIH
ncbi:MAG: stage II sporulation protein P [Clostridia bacterium]|nr:stage II sporulation protein P [Clostridia bacterium]